MVRHLARFSVWTENQRVGGSIFDSAPGHHQSNRTGQCMRVDRDRNNADAPVEDAGERGVEARVPLSCERRRAERCKVCGCNQ